MSQYTASIIIRSVHCMCTIVNVTLYAHIHVLCPCDGHMYALYVNVTLYARILCPCDGHMYTLVATPVSVLLHFFLHSFLCNID